MKIEIRRGNAKRPNAETKLMYCTATVTYILNPVDLAYCWGSDDPGMTYRSFQTNGKVLARQAH